MKYKLLFFGFLVVSKFCYSQKIKLNSDDKFILATALREQIGTTRSHNTALFLDSSLVQLINVDLPYRSATNAITVYAKNNNWDFIYSYSDKLYLKHAVEVPVKKIFKKIKFYPNFSNKYQPPYFGPIIYNGDRTKAFVILLLTEPLTTIYMFFENQKGKWILKHKDGIYLID